MAHPSAFLRKSKLVWFFLLLGGILFASSLATDSQAAPQSVQFTKRIVRGVRFYQTTIDLADPHTHVAIGLANRAQQANSSQASKGDESFRAFVGRQHASVVASGTFFSLDAQKRVMGNMVSGGRFLKYSPWENYGTTLGIGPDKRLEMVTARVDGKPAWRNHWFSLTAGPRLLRKGKISLAPRSEGFADPRVLGAARRAAIGYTAGGRKLILVTFISKVSLRKEAQIMRALGCTEALNLDGGSSLGLAKSGKMVVWPGRRLTNV
ncbi:MAG TPA: phosphodiester glycosidase family protein, partial [Candidatus Caenarcaniphilales bacterium]